MENRKIAHGRDQQMQVLRDFVWAAMEPKSCRSLFISGTPGTGKTASSQQILQEVVEELAKVKPARVKRIEIIYINVMKLVNPSVLDQQLQTASTNIWKNSAYKASKRATEKAVMSRLPQFLESVKAGRKAKVMPFFLVDELDQLTNRPFKSCLQILRTLLQESTTLEFGIISIANSFDADDILLDTLEWKAVGLQRLFFPSYQAEELKEIINHVMGDLQIFEPCALNFLCKTGVSHFQGDCRKVLDLCNRLYLRHQGDGHPIGVREVNAFTQTLQMSGQFAKAAANLPLHQKLVLGVLCQMSQGGVLSSIHDRAIRSIKHLSLQLPTQLSYTAEALEGLKAGRFISTNQEKIKGRNNSETHCLVAPISEVVQALIQSEPLFKNFLAEVATT